MQEKNYRTRYRMKRERKHKIQDKLWQIQRESNIYISKVPKEDKKKY